MSADINYNELLVRIENLNELKVIRNKIETGIRTVSLKYLQGSLPSLFVVSLWKKLKRNFIIIVSDKAAAEDFYNDISILKDEKEIILFNEPQRSHKFESNAVHHTVGWQIDAAVQIISENDKIIVTTTDMLDVRLPLPVQVKDCTRKLKNRDIINMNEFALNLSLNGFERVDYVSKQGEISIRGGILDFFPAGWNNPLRLEFVGDEIESIREFDLISQRSIVQHKDINFIENVFHDSIDSGYSTLLDYIGSNPIIVVLEPEKSGLDDNLQKRIIHFQNIYINGLGIPDIEIRSESQPVFNGSIRLFSDEIKSLFIQKTEIFISADGDIHLNRIKDLVENIFPYENNISDENTKLFENIKWLDESLSQGFYLPDDNIAFFTEHQIFNRHKFTINKKKRRDAQITLKELRQLKIGDYIVHDDKGIGLFDGFKTIEMGGSRQDCVRLLYADDDVVYVNLNYLHKIQLYTTTEGVVPKVTKLGSGEWFRKKNRTKGKLKDIARELIKLYAERKMQPGYPFPADTIWQKEMEASFIYEDTPDQAATTTDVKNDMESHTPMDRLVCGDVGFGKTEVAVRASFKAVQSGKQVAILVPTTILAQQHYMTLVDRLNSYPVLIEVLSRFKGKAQQNIILDKLKSGGIDIIIGTHRLLSKDVEFKDLGLLIIDEEHRFGVGAKEKLRQLRVNIDTLTLTATPIPRTLNFSLLGARDISNIETPPRNRLPIYTELLEWNFDKVKEAIELELNRNGQVFFVNDKIEDLEQIANDLKLLIPNLRIGVAHGQMPAHELEKVMEKFISGKIEVLITTKIIESGIDIPNANTMIINHSDNFGLAELYQLRGRVGRTNIQAYCYLIIPPVKNLSDIAIRRLKAIEEFTDLGSGFRLALRDLELRGAGNLLGPEQSGYINEIGFDLYHKILDEAVSELRYDEFPELFVRDDIIKKSTIKNDDVEIDLAQDAFLPDTYIRSETERFMYYKKLYTIKDNDQLLAVTNELLDKYGRMPDEASALFYAVKIRIAALNTGLTKIIIKNERMFAEFPPESNKEFYDIAFPVIMEYISEMDNCKLIHNKKKLLLEARLSSRDEAIEFLWRMKKTIDNEL